MQDQLLPLTGVHLYIPGASSLLLVALLGPSRVWLQLLGPLGISPGGLWGAHPRENTMESPPGPSHLLLQGSHTWLQTKAGTAAPLPLLNEWQQLLKEVNYFPLKCKNSTLKSSG